MIVKGRNDKGFALIMTLFIIVFLMAAVLSFKLSSKWSIESTRNFRLETEAYYLALSGYDTALRYLMNDDDPQVDFIDEKGIFYVDSEHEPLPETMDLDNGTITFKISDEQARVNLNKTNQNVLRKLFDYVGAESDEQDELIDCLLDWIDADDDHHLNGVEDEYYEDYGYQSKDGHLETVEELLLVKGYSEELLYGGEESAPLAPLITTFGEGTFNINTASKDLMSMLGASEIDIENVMRYRDSESGGLRSIPSNLSSLGFNRTFSRYIRVEISAEAKQSGIRYIITAIAKRTPHKQGYKIETVFWRENVSYS